MHASLLSSFHHLRNSLEDSSSESTVIDSVVLHSPFKTMGETLEAWQTLESYVPVKIRHLGISNISFSILEDLYNSVKVKPAVVQNRFYRSTKFDSQVRDYCRTHSIIYEAFWTLTANPAFLKSRLLQEAGRQMGLSPEQTWYCLILGLEDTVILNGTGSVLHMREDIAALARARTWAVDHSDAWNQFMRDFESLIAL